VPVLEVENLSKTFGEGELAVHALREASFSVEAGELVALLGPSGSGKSTLLLCISLIQEPSSGRIAISGRDVWRDGPLGLDDRRFRRENIGFIFQGHNLIPFLTAEENVGMPLVLDGVKQGEVDARVKDALALVNMSHRAAHHPTHLSGGEQQRVAIARALVIRPAIVLADEPTGNLDRAGGRAVMDLVHEINEQTGVTVLLVTHDPVFAAYAGKVLRLVDGALQQAMELPDAGAPPDEDLTLAQ